jgi:uncharacterized coiled-coil protein SlyX
MEDLEARVAALEASQADYRAVLEAANALGANHREMATTLREHSRILREHSEALDELKAGHSDTNARVRSLEDGVVEIKDLLVRALDRPQENS